MRRIVILFSLLSCIACNTINPSIMFKTDRNYKFESMSTEAKDYKISVNDNISFSLFSNEGYKMVDVTGTGMGTNQSTNEFLVEKDGHVKLPVLGRIKITDITVQEAEQLLEGKYSVYYKRPFVILKVTNKRVILFPGNNSAGTVVNLRNENTTLIEVIAQAGGLSGGARAKRIKVIRGDLHNPKIYLINLATIEGIKQANLLVQPNDIIYVETVPRISQEVLAQLSPLMSLLTSFLFLYDLIIRK